MREMKFRFWNKKLRRMSKPYGLGIIYEYLVSEWGCFDWTDVDKRQYTGQKDKYGVEVYEGDTIRAMMDFGPGGFHKKTAVVKWDNEYGYQWNYFDLSTIEVIGNIYENSALVKED